jgi:DNA-binding CsgD family transcriptional regulator
MQYISKREKEILKWLKKGKSSWEISVILNISERTVNFHVGNIMQKLNAVSRTHAVAIYIEKGIDV